MIKVAIVHDFLVQMGGAEKVVEAFHDLFPDAPVYTSLYDPEAMPACYRSWDIRTSFLQKMPFKHRIHRVALGLYPLAFESFDLSSYDLVLSSSSAFAKGVVTTPKTVHVCYNHTPMRYAWTSEQYMKNERSSRISRLLLLPILHYLRMWDAASASRVDHYIANSSTVAQRIEKFYGRGSDIICPPVDTERFFISPQVSDYYILVSRFVPYKRLDIAVEAMTRLNRPLKVVGSGRQMQTLKEKAGPTIEFLGRVSDADLPDLLSRARAYLMPGEEDFGIAPVEANACGRPVIAYGSGGALDSQIDGVTGVLFPQQTVESLCDAVLRADSINFHPQRIREHALQFDIRAFQARIERLVYEVAGFNRTVVRSPYVLDTRQEVTLP